jgi:hypothetical protein
LGEEEAKEKDRRSFKRTHDGVEGRPTCRRQRLFTDAALALSCQRRDQTAEIISAVVDALREAEPVPLSYRVIPQF